MVRLIGAEDNERSLNATNEPKRAWTLGSEESAKKRFYVETIRKPGELNNFQP